MSNNNNWVFGSTPTTGDAWMLIGKFGASARYFPLQEPWDGYKAEFWSQLSYLQFGPVKCMLFTDERECREACENWLAEAEMRNGCN